MRAAAKTAKSDFLGKLMEKTRRRRAAVKPYTTFDLILFLGKLLYYVGIAGQLSWNISVLLLNLEVNQVGSPYSSYLTAFMTYVRPLVNLATSEVWARNSLRCSLAAMWWNPRFKELNNGFMKHVTGFAEWYKVQLTHIAIRLLFYYITGTSVLSDLYSEPSLAAHTVSLLLISIVSDCSVLPGAQTNIG